MKLSIITINYNNAAGLKKTLDSVAGQKLDFRLQMADRKLGNEDFQLEHVIVDGESTDGSVDIIRDYVLQIANCGLQIAVKWVSEKDKGIYNAMNKGIEIAMGKREVDDFNRSKRKEDKNKASEDDYIQILNSGDQLAGPDVCNRMLSTLSTLNSAQESPVGILYGNMIKQYADGTCIQDRLKNYSAKDWTMYDFIRGTINHDPTYISQTMYHKYGLYREDLPITADWRWFVEAVAFGGEKPIHIPMDVTIFDMTGVSETQLVRREQERDAELQRILPLCVYKDYQQYHFPISQMQRLHRHPFAYKLVWFIERVCFKLEKWGMI